MNLNRSSLGWLVGLVVLAVALGAVLVAPSTASAGPPSIHPSSCGGLGADGTYCSYETDGTDVVIGPNSCTVIKSCLNLGNGTRINAGGLPFLEGSCNDDAACNEAGVSGGSFKAGNGSCNGYSACYAAGRDGSFEAGSGSCNLDLACQTAGVNGGSFKAAAGSCNGDNACVSAGEDGGNTDISHDSCNGPDACDMAGSDGGNFVAGIHSCHADTACLSAGRDGSFEVGHDSCNVAYACEYAGQIGDGPSSVGNFSCNYSDNVYNTECAGDVSGSRPDVGDCMYNDPSPLQVIILRALGCALFGPLDQTELDVLWQAILAIFVFD